MSRKPFIVNLPRVLILLNGWLVFQFLSVEDCNDIENHFWVLGEGALVRVG